MKRFILICLLANSFLGAQGVDKGGILLQLNPEFSGIRLSLNDTFSLNNNPITIQTCKFYLSQIQLLKNGKTIWREENSYHLVDISNEKTLMLKLNAPANIEYNEIQFQLGIDSLTNVSGAFGDDLDPTNGMYWTWQSGYINFKLEGYCSACTTRNHFFEFHLGGYLPPYQSVQTIRLKVPVSEKINIGIDIGTFLKGTDLVKDCAVMSPGTKAQKLSQLASTIFSCK